MRLSPLQLIEYAFDGVSIQPVRGYIADPEFAPGLVFFPGKLAISADTGIALLNEAEKFSDFGLQLTLRVGPKEGTSAPYQIDMALRGVVRMHGTGLAANDRHDRALVNGISLLYGAVREMVGNITSRAVHGPFHLPALNFSDLVQNGPAPAGAENVAPPATKLARKSRKAAR